MTHTEQRLRTRQFIQRWTGRGYEKGESQTFWLDLLSLLGVDNPADFIRFESQVQLDHTSFIDGFIPSTHILIEQKSLGKDLLAPIKQSDGKLLTPFKQAKRYAAELPYDDRPRWIVISNFAEFHVYDMNQPNGEPACILLRDLEKELYRLDFLIKTQDTALQREEEISLAAGELVGKLYDALLAQYIDPTSPHTLHSLNALCVRLVFCLYAEDAGLFPSHTAFHDFLIGKSLADARTSLIALFRILDTPEEQRDPYADPRLLAFPYVNGGLFKDETIEIPRFSLEILRLLLQDCSANFDWSGISPTIFGAVFESTLNPETRRSGGMHYTSIKNIHKVIDPLFLGELTASLQAIEKIRIPSKRKRALTDFRRRLSSLTFLDPACGSGNFLTETYLSLRRLENKACELLFGSGMQELGGGDFSPIKVSITQFYGIEINDFAATVAKTALWIAECQMMIETENIVGRDLDFLPLKTYTNITVGNALNTDWESVVPKHSLKYIMGNPPFVGANNMNTEQRADMRSVFGEKWKNIGEMDYVCCWYKKATEFIKGTDILCAFVSTNSICQGEQVPNLWKPLFEQGLHFNFAYRTFRWDSEAKLKAHVHCVIVGFSSTQGVARPILFDGETHRVVSHINAYLIDVGDVFIESRNTPICDVPRMCKGNQPTDGGNLIISSNELDAFLAKEPAAKPFIHLFVGSIEFINNKQRYCLWLKGASPAQLHNMPQVMERIRRVREIRLASSKAATRKCADMPSLFQEIRQPNTNFLLVPSTSSERRRYVPIGFMGKEIIPSNSCLIIPSATLYHFGVLTSNVHMAWMRAVCGRLKSDYRYSKDIVYNNFPWPTPTDEQRKRIEQTAQAILDARALSPDCSLAELYDEVLMPAELRKAHQDNDRAVMAAYDFPIKNFSESDIVARLMQQYEKLTNR